MESLKLLELIYSDALNFNENEEDIEEVKREYNIIKRDLERLKKIDDFKSAGLVDYALGRLIKLDIENEKLKQENKELLVNKNVAQGIATKYKQKLKQIEALPNCDICDENWHKGCMCLQKKIKEVLGNE